MFMSSSHKRCNVLDLKNKKIKKKNESESVFFEYVDEHIVILTYNYSREELIFLKIFED